MQKAFFITIVATAGMHSSTAMNHAGVQASHPIQPLLHQKKIRPKDLLIRDGICPSGHHPCSDLNSSSCCQNTEYCIVNETSLAIQCCPLGSNCGGPCDEDSFYSLVTTTITTSASTNQLVVETAAVCIGRNCTRNTYLCPEDLGGHCCAFGTDCAQGGTCSSSSGTNLATTATIEALASATASAAVLDTIDISSAVDTSRTGDDMLLKIGLGVGIPAAIIGFAVLAFVWRIRRARNRDITSKEDEQEEYMKPELHADEIIPPAELETHVAELPAQILETEMPEQGIVAELSLEAAIESRGKMNASGFPSRGNSWGYSDGLGC